MVQGRRVLEHRDRHGLRQVLGDGRDGVGEQPGPELGVDPCPRDNTGAEGRARVVARRRFGGRDGGVDVVGDRIGKYFDIKTDSPYMLMVAPVNEERRRPMTAEEEALFGIDKLNVPRSDIPAVTHIDYSARIQTVHRETNPDFHALLEAFKAKTDSVVVNTSFNVRGEPIVCTPEDAWRCFMGSEIEVLVIGNCFLRKEDQDPALKLDYKNAFELD